MKNVNIGIEGNHFSFGLCMSNSSDVHAVIFGVSGNSDDASLYSPCSSDITMATCCAMEASHVSPWHISVWNSFSKPCVTTAPFLRCRHRKSSSSDRGLHVSVCTGLYRDLHVQLSPAQHQHCRESHAKPDTRRHGAAAAAQAGGQSGHADTKVVKQKSFFWKYYVKFKKPINIFLI